MDLTTLAATITALGVVFGAIFAAHKWFLKQEKQDADIKAIKEEQTVLVHWTEIPRRTPSFVSTAESASRLFPSGNPESSARMPAVPPGGTATWTALTERLFMTSPAPAAGKPLPPMGIETASIVPTAATLQGVLERGMPQVNDAYRAKLERYLASMLQAKRMLEMGILTPEDYAHIDTIIAKKHGISSCSLYRGIDLIYDGFRGNMSHYKEVTKCPEQ